MQTTTHTYAKAAAQAASRARAAAKIAKDKTRPMAMRQAAAEEARAAAQTAKAAAQGAAECPNGYPSADRMAHPRDVQDAIEHAQAAAGAARMAKEAIA